MNTTEAHALTADLLVGLAARIGAIPDVIELLDDDLRPTPEPMRAADGDWFPARQMREVL
jgi:hypothetical protein